MNRRDFLKRAISASTITVIHSFFGCSANVRPNILWIISEDTSPDFACYGNSIVSTPNVDRLAKEGTRFTRAFATAPVCSPSRSAFNTGLYQTSIGAHQHRTKFKKPLLPPVQVVTDYFRNAGYFTCNSSALNFDKPGKTDWNFTLDHEPFDGTDWRQRKPGQPFFAQINLHLTHRKFIRDRQRPIDPDSVTLPPIYPNHPVLRRDWADYLESIQVLDRQIGQILQRLEEDQLIENTVVFYFGDHGRPHLWAKQWLYEGGIRVPLIVRWPEHVPAGASNDDLISLLDLLPTSLTLAGLSVPGYLQGMNMFDDKIKKRDCIFAARDRCDETVDRIRCVRTKRYKYIRNFMPDKPYTQFNTYKTNQYPAVPVFQFLHEQGKLTPAQERFMAARKPEEELYDLENDPFEIHNLASNPGYQNILQDLRQRLNKWIEETHDMGATAEPEEELNFWKERQAARHINFMKQKGLTPNSPAEAHIKYWEKRFNKQ